MTREELKGLPAEKLIDLILQLEARIAELEARLSQPPKTPHNSSIPPAKAFKPNKKSSAPGSRKRGPKYGHPGTTRAGTEPDLKIEAKIENCDRCGEGLASLEQQMVESRQVVELPPVRPVVIEAQVYQVVCPSCGQVHKAQFPEAFSAPQSFGPYIQALVSYFHEVHHLPYGRLAQMLEEVLSLKVSAGSLVNLVRRTGQALESEAEAIRLEVVQSPVIGSDETGARVDGVNQWQWVFRTPNASYYVIVPSRGSQVISEVLGEARPQVWISDLWSAQQKAPANRFQLCHAHQLRDLEYAEDCGDKAFAPAMQKLLLKSQALARERDERSPERFQAKKQAIYRKCERLLVKDTPHLEGRKLQRRYRKHRDKLFVFLERADVPYDNNGSERDLRNSVIHRKVTGGFRSEWAPGTFATITTVIETAKKRGQGVLATLLAGVGRTLPIGVIPAEASSPPSSGT